MSSLRRRRLITTGKDRERGRGDEGRHQKWKMPVALCEGNRYHATELLLVSKTHDGHHLAILVKPSIGDARFFGPFPPRRRPQRGPPPPPPACLSLCAPSLLLFPPPSSGVPLPLRFPLCARRRRRLFRGRRCSILSSLSLLALGAGRTKQKTHAAEEEEETPLTTKARAARRPTTTRPWSSKIRRGKSEDFAARGNSARKESVPPSPCVQLECFFGEALCPVVVLNLHHHGPGPPRQAHALLQPFQAAPWLLLPLPDRAVRGAEALRSQDRGWRRRRGGRGGSRLRLILRDAPGGDFSKFDIFLTFSKGVHEGYFTHKLKS